MTNWLDDIKSKFTLEKPVALQWHEWKEWEAKMQEETPLAYWLNETVPEFFSDVNRKLTGPFKELKSWIRYRVFDKYHVVKTGLKPGYHEIDSRMLHSLFQLLVDFVEIEKAWMHVVWSEDNKRTFNVPWYSQGMFRIKNWRSRDAGLAYLDWECTLNSPTLSDNERSDAQAETAYVIIELYKWWTEVRPNRPDPMDISGWDRYCRERIESGKEVLDTRTESEEEEREVRRLLDLTHKIEEEQYQEDTEMLNKLIEIRRSLWT